MLINRFIFFFTQNILTPVFSACFTLQHTSAIQSPRDSEKLSFLSHIKPWTCTESYTKTNLGDAWHPNEQKAQLLSSSRYVAAPPSALWQAPSPLHVSLYPESFCLLPPFGLEVSQDRNLLMSERSPTIPKITTRHLPVTIHCFLYFKTFPC